MGLALSRPSLPARASKILIPLLTREFDISTSLLNMAMSQPEHVLQHIKAGNVGEDL